MRNFKTIAFAGVVAAAAAGGSAFTASNTVSQSSAVGQGTATTAGFTVSDIKYKLHATLTDGAGDYVTDVTFTLTPDSSGPVAEQARVRLVTSGTYYECVRGTVTGTVSAWACDINGTTGIAASTVNRLDVVATSHKAP